MKFSLAGPARQESSAIWPRSRAEQQKPKCGRLLGLLRRVARELKGRERTQASRFAGSKHGETRGKSGRAFSAVLAMKDGADWMQIFGVRLL